jgi:hypothetical protein
MPAPLSGPGLGLQLPQNLYPTALFNAPYDIATNRIALAPGDCFTVPPGTYWITQGLYCVIQYQDPVTGVWVTSSGAAHNRGPIYIKSDGVTTRVANLTGCPVGAAIYSQGGGWTQATTTVTVTGGGGSTWSPIIGGELTFASVITANSGAGYGAPPLVMFPAPPPGANNPNGVGGIAATGWCGISSGTISGFTFTNPGAGYTGNSLTVICYPSLFDPNINTGITLGTLTFSVGSAGALTGVLCTNNGVPPTTANSITLALAGGGSNATISAIFMLTTTSVSVPTGAAAGWGTVAALVTSIGGSPPKGSISANPEFSNIAWGPRPLQAQLTVTAAGSLAPQGASILDGGLFECVSTSLPTPGVVLSPPVPNGSLALETSSIVLTLGGTADFFHIQPAA